MAIDISNNHWTVENYRERMPASKWKKMLLDDEDTILYKGDLIRLKAKKLGYGVVEVYKGGSVLDENKPTPKGE